MLKQPISVDLNLLIRNAIENDCDDIMRLINELAIYEKLPDQVRINSQNKLIYVRELALKEDGFGSRPLYICLVAEDLSQLPSRIVGMCLMFNVYSTWEGKSLHLEDLYVQENYRKRGIGKALFSAVYQIAVDTNCARLNFNVLDWNTDAIEFYKSRGALDLTEKEGWHMLRVSRQNIESYLNESKNN